VIALSTQIGLAPPSTIAIPLICADVVVAIEDKVVGIVEATALQPIGAEICPSKDMRKFPLQMALDVVQSQVKV
jgi:hypothetical protein